jgi:hypothetical protein
MKVLLDFLSDHKKKDIFKVASVLMQTMVINERPA